MPICNRCKKEKPLEAFYTAGKKRAHSYSCKECDRIRTKAYRQSERGKERREAFRQSERGKECARRSSMSLATRASNARSRGALDCTAELISDLLAYQNNRCAICKGPFSSSRNGTFCIEHDHATNKTRGLVCFRCNTNIGYLEKSKYVVPPFQAFQNYLANTPCECVQPSKETTEVLEDQMQLAMVDQ